MELTGENGIIARSIPSMNLVELRLHRGLPIYFVFVRLFAGSKIFYYDHADITSPDDGESVIVTAGGHRYKVFVVGQNSGTVNFGYERLNITEDHQSVIPYIGDLFLPGLTQLKVNGVGQAYGIDYTIDITVKEVTWLSTDFSLEQSDMVEIHYFKKI